MNTNKSNTLVLVFVAYLLSYSNCLAGTYPLEKGKMFFQTTAKYVYAESYYDYVGEKFPLAATSELSNTSSGEVGLTEKISLFFQISLYRYYTTQGPNDKSPFDIFFSGPGDSEIGAKYGIYRTPLLGISAWTKLGLPTSETVNGYTKVRPHIPLNHNDIPSYLGFDMETYPFEFPLTLGTTFGFKARNYGQGSNNYSDATVFGLKATYPYKKIFFILSGDGEFSHWNGVPQKDVSYFRFGPQMYAQLEKNIGLVLGVESSVYNHNVLSGMAYKAGLYLSR